MQGIGPRLAPASIGNTRLYDPFAIAGKRGLGRRGSGTSIGSHPLGTGRGMLDLSIWGDGSGISVIDPGRGSSAVVGIKKSCITAPPACATLKFLFHRRLHRGAVRDANG